MNLVKKAQAVDSFIGIGRFFIRILLPNLSEPRQRPKYPPSETFVPPFRIE